MFYDEAKIYVKGGDGGNGIVAFRREKYVARGGPSGGDGGRGGSVILKADAGLRTLVDFRYRAHYRAERGQHGQGKDRHGRSAPDLILRVPAGVVVRDAATGQVLADLVVDGQQVVVAAGGRGGRGNARFVSPTDRAPAFAEKGEPGEERWLRLELKLLADAGLVGLPNAGKSTLLARISAARPKIAAYPFTTLAPNLGVVRLEDGKSFVVADIPGLIAGAHQGAGLGLKFLRHIERTRVLVHVLDITHPAKEVLANWQTVNDELAHYNPELAQRPQVVAANKMDLPGGEEKVALLQEQLGPDYRIFPIAAATGEGINALLYHLAGLLDTLPPPAPVTALEEEAEKVTIVAPEELSIEREGGAFVVRNPAIERRVAMTYLDNEEALRRLQAYLKEKGVDEALRRAGATAGATIRIGKYEFEYVEE
ncbi:GTPase ObgE [Moorella naiadis]|uniref:GTPase ObgE n=1 Tax=Moorella naiadis (nom. illeg.) TaxID=3093670 RepID=UPI003D9C8922